MGLTFLPVCMDSSEWLQVTANEENGMDSSSSPSGDMLTCSRPLIERRLRPQHDQALKCPRCDSTHTKFCYYNNYSLSQPRYFCKTCRRYWTKGGTLRNIPVGGGCRKNKKVTSKKSNDHHPIMNQNPGGPSTHNPTDLHLSFPDQVQFSTAHISNLLGTPAGIGNNHGLPVVDFMEGKIEAIIGNSRNYDFMGNNCEMSMAGLGDHHGGLALAPNFHGLCSPFGVTAIDGNSGTFMLPYQENLEQNAMDVKPNTKLLSLDWQDQGCSDVGKDSFVYLNNVGSWNGMISNGYGPSTTNPLV